jgi:plasmid stability protein
MMRTTLNLPDDINEVLRARAQATGLSLGDAAAELIRRGLRSDSRLAEEMGIPCFSIPEHALPITMEQTLAAEDDR